MPLFAFPSKAPALLAGVLLLSLISTLPAHAERICPDIFAWTYTNHYDSHHSSQNIGTLSCPGALNGQVVVGMDADSEWVGDFPVHLGSQTSLVDSLRYATGLNYVERFAIVYLDPFAEDTLAVDTLGTMLGLGIH